MHQSSFLNLGHPKMFRLAIFSCCHKKNIWKMKCGYCKRTVGRTKRQLYALPSGSMKRMSKVPSLCWLRLLKWQPTNCLTINNVYLGFLNDAVWSLSTICCKSDDKTTRQTYRDVNVQSNLNSFNSFSDSCLWLDLAPSPLPARQNHKTKLRRCKFNLQRFNLVTTAWDKGLDPLRLIPPSKKKLQEKVIEM